MRWVGSGAIAFATVLGGGLFLSKIVIQEPTPVDIHCEEAISSYSPPITKELRDGDLEPILEALDKFQVPNSSTANATVNGTTRSRQPERDVANVL